MKGVMLLRESPLNSQTTNPQKKTQKSPTTLHGSAAARSGLVRSPFKETASANLQRNPNPETTPSAKSHCFTGGGGGGGGPQASGVGRKKPFSNPGGVTQIYTAPQNGLTQQSSHLSGPGAQEMESTNCPTDSGYELLVSGTPNGKKSKKCPNLKKKTCSGSSPS